MEMIIDIFGFFGSWLLVAGPIFQASLELRDQDIEFERIHEVRKSLTPPKHVSPWWWVVPPVKIYLSHRASEVYKQRYVEALLPEDVDALTEFRSKALGWLMVATGGLLLACKETYELSLHFALPEYIVVIVAIVMAIVSVSFTIGNSVRRDRLSRTKPKSKAA